MKTLNQNCKADITEKKSKFICNIFHVETKQEAEDIIAKLKKEHHDARHNCYAYIIYDAIEDNFITKSNDDGEPSGTAGSPILSVLQSYDMVNTLAIVTRYFGGVLLGTGGLVRAYKQATLKAIENACLYNVEKGYLVSVEISYSDNEKLKYFCKKNNINIIKTEYLKNIKYILEVNEQNMQKFSDILTGNNIKIDIICQKTIKTA